MKRTIVLIAIAAITLLLLPIALFSAPKDYLGAEGSSYGLIISQEAKQEAMQARADRFLLYQDEIDISDADGPALEASVGGGIGGSLEVVIMPTDTDNPLIIGKEDPLIVDPADGDAGTCGKLGCSDPPMTE